MLKPSFDTVRMIAFNTTHQIARPSKTWQTIPPITQIYPTPENPITNPLHGMAGSSKGNPLSNGIERFGHKTRSSHRPRSIRRH